MTDAAPRRVCFITTEFHGLFKNGGIGTANTGLALALAEAGLDVTVAFAASDPGGPRLKTGNFAQLKANYFSRGIVLDYVPPYPGIPAAFDDPRPASLSVLAYLLAGRFDIVLFNDNGGQGFYAMLAKHTGVFGDAPLMVLVTHGPFDWVLDLNAIEYWNRHPVIAAFMERRCAALADMVVSPSRYMIDWMSGQGWAVSPNTRVIQNLVGTAGEGPGPARAGQPAPAPIREIVFFGRQEVRKGLALFCDAMDLLAARTDLSGLTVTFMGKFSNLGNLHAGVFVAERSLAWPATLRVASEFDQAQALDYLARSGVLAVIPSLAENSPCVVVECLALGLPFLASDSGGTAELIAPEDHACCLFAPDPAALAEKLAGALRDGAASARLAVPQREARRQWLGLLQGELPQAPAALGHKLATALVSVCLVQLGQRALHAGCLLSIRQQTHVPIEIIIAWDGTGTCETGDPGEVPVRIIRTGAADCGAALLECVRAASGDYLLFVDDAAVSLLPTCIETFLCAAWYSGADLLTCLPAIDPGLDARSQAQAMPLGACPEIGAFENCFGESVIFATRRCFNGDFPDILQQVIGEDRRLQDWVFLACAALHGAALEVVPQPLYTSGLAPAMPRGGWQTVRRLRRVMKVFRAAPAATFARIIEGLMQVGAQSGRQNAAMLSAMPPAAAETARRLATLEPNSLEAQRAFITFCAQRQLPALAIDYAMLNGALHVAEAELAAREACGEAVLQTLRRRRVATWHQVDLSADIATRIRAVPPLNPAALRRGDGWVVEHGLGPDIAMLKAVGVCPPGTIALSASAQWAPGTGTVQKAEPVRFALVACDREARLLVSDTVRSTRGSLSWSGWVEAGLSGRADKISVSLPEPPADAQDIFLLAQRMGAANGPALPVRWRDIKADVLISPSVSPSRIELKTWRAFVTEETMRAGVVVTDVSDFPLPVYVPGERTLLHPVPGRNVVARLAASCPEGALGVRATVSLEHEQSRPVDFALWLLPASPVPLDPAGLDVPEYFSGWHSVFEPLTQHHLSLLLPEPARGAMDLYLGTRVSRSADAYFCHAYWNELWFVEPGRKEGLLF
jgi:glycosyltransferase involved in cell wall biosynthesis